MRAIEIWSRALYALQDFPFTGVGLGAFRRVVNVLYPLFLVPPGRGHRAQPQYVSCRSASTSV